MGVLGLAKGTFFATSQFRWLEDSPVVMNSPFDEAVNDSNGRA